MGRGFAVSAQDQNGDGLLSRAELEIELARLVLAVERKHPVAEGEAPVSEAFATWFESTSVDLLGRVGPEMRPFCLERLQQIAQSNAGLSLVKLDLEAADVSFAPSADVDGSNGAP
ncbi:hypothetical protein ACVWZN_000470 [Lysobacter sp. HA35]